MLVLSICKVVHNGNVCLRKCCSELQHYYGWQIGYVAALLEGQNTLHYHRDSDSVQAMALPSLVSSGVLLRSLCRLTLPRLAAVAPSRVLFSASAAAKTQKEW